MNFSFQNSAFYPTILRVTETEKQGGNRTFSAQPVKVGNQPEAPIGLIDANDRKARSTDLDHFLANVRKPQMRSFRLLAVYGS